MMDCDKKLRKDFEQILEDYTYKDKIDKSNFDTIIYLMLNKVTEHCRQFVATC